MLPEFSNRPVAKFAQSSDVFCPRQGCTEDTVKECVLNSEEIPSAAIPEFRGCQKYYRCGVAIGTHIDCDQIPLQSTFCDYPDLI